MTTADLRKTAPQRSYRNLSATREASLTCRACPLWKHATQTVFGEGAHPAPIMLVGEQPGDKEDLEGKPFVGPAGKLLDRALRDAGIARDSVYITNAVKHFKFIQRGKRRMHQRPAAPEVAACLPWLQHEIVFVAPRVIVLLGTTALRAVLGKPGTIKAMRGAAIALKDGRAAFVTVHPSSLLRAPDENSRREGYAAFVRDLRAAAQYGLKNKRGPSKTAPLQT